MNHFSVLTQDGAARAGVFRTAHGVFETPQFMPVGTRASVKGIDCERLRELGAQITLVNTYHLWQRPGPRIISDLGGVHAFCGWAGPILSDSGGFQVYSLKRICRVSDEGVEFRSHLDGSLQFLSPEKSVQIQEQLGVDIAMALDECPEGSLDQTAAKRSWELTLRWAKRCLAAKTRAKTDLFGITQGGVHRSLRSQAAAELSELPFDGFAIGGLSVGEPKDAMYEVLSYHPAQLPTGKIRYLMGVGTPADIVEAVHAGVDLFDCVMPTRAGRFGRAFVRGEAPFINIKNARYAQAEESLDPSCVCLACRNYSRAYLNHLFKVGEMLGPQLVSIHNLTHYMELMASLRSSITGGCLEEFYRKEKSRWQGVGEESEGQ